MNRLLAKLEKRFGTHRYDRLDTHFPLEKRAELMKYCAEHPPAKLAGSPIAEIKTFDADAVIQRLEEAGLTVRDPSGYVMKAVERVRRGGTAGWSGAVGRCATCGAQGHLARDCPSAARGAPPDSLASLPSPPSARGSRAPRPGDWICGVCKNHNFASRIECNRCGTPKSGEQPNGRVGGFPVPRPTRRRSRSRSRERRRRGHRS